MKKILIIEDDPVTARIYSTRLEEEGYEVNLVMDGQSGMNRLLQFHPDAVLLDLMLPRISGLEVLKKIRALEEFKNVPVIVYTNVSVPKMVEEAMAAGATRVFDKATVTIPMLLLAFQEAQSKQ